MLKPGAKRFYQRVEVKEGATGFAIMLDAKPVKTPAGLALAAPTRALADAVAQEWRAQAADIAPETMPLTKFLNTALDRVALHRTTIVEDLAKYAGHDPLCYRASGPAELVRRQSAAWDPWLDWAAERHGARLAVTTGITHVDQPQEALAQLASAIEAHGDHALVALHTVVTITGSAVLGLAFAARALDAVTALAASRIDEDFQAERWGKDQIAHARLQRRQAEMKAAERFLDLLA